MSQTLLHSSTKIKWSDYQCVVKLIKLHVNWPWMHWSVHQLSQKWVPHCKQRPVATTHLHSWWKQFQTLTLLCTWNYNCTGIANVCAYMRYIESCWCAVCWLIISDFLSLSLSLRLCLFSPSLFLPPLPSLSHNFGLKHHRDATANIGYAYPSHIWIAALWIDAVIGDDVLESLTYSATTAAIVTKRNCIEWNNRHIEWIAWADKFVIEAEWSWESDYTKSHWRWIVKSKVPHMTVLLSVHVKLFTSITPSF